MILCDTPLVENVTITGNYHQDIKEQKFLVWEWFHREGWRPYAYKIMEVLEDRYQKEKFYTRI